MARESYQRHVLKAKLLALRNCIAHIKLCSFCYWNSKTHVFFSSLIIFPFLFP